MVGGITFPKLFAAQARDPGAARAPAAVEAPGNAASAAARGGVKEAASLSHESVRELIAQRNTRVVLFRDQSSGRIVGQILDRGDGRVIAQYPPDELLNLYASVRDDLREQFEIRV